MTAFDKVIGYEEIKLELRRYADILKNPDKYAKLGVNMPSGLMLYGEPGLGKSLMAKCFIEASGCKAFILRKEKPNGEFVVQIKEIFEQAKAEGPAIVYLDDMDKFANEDKMHPDAEEYVTVQSCIDECKEYGVFTLATVNDRYCLPDSLLRVGRFDKTIEVEAPSVKDAPRIIEHYLKDKTVSEEIDIEEIARIMVGKSCAQLENVINEAGIYAGFEDRSDIRREDIIKACLRLIFETPKCMLEDDTELDKVSVIHEAGHTVVAEVLDPGIVSLVSVYCCREDDKGVVVRKQLDNHDWSKEFMEHDVMGALAGKAAVEAIYGITELGCEHDIRSARKRLEHLLTRLCEYGFEEYDGYEKSQFVLEKVDRMIAWEMERLYHQAKKIILDNREFLDAVVAALMKKKTLTFRDITEIRQSVTIVI